MNSDELTHASGRDGNTLRPPINRRHFLQSILAGGAVMLIGRPGYAGAPSYAEGVVFHDRTGTGSRDARSVGLPGVRVSNGREIAVTDERGRWRLPLEGERTTFFVIKPRNWRTALTGNNLPRFHYIHDPEGSPPLQYKGLSPTGPLPASVDFPLYPQEEPDDFRVILCGDPQPRNALEVGYLAQSAIPELAKEEAAFGFSLGDIMFDNLEFFEPLNEAFRHIDKPWYNVLGNHDLNFDTPDNHHANDTFMRIYGPTYYAFEYGPVHFIVLNNVDWMGQDPERPRGTQNYRGHFGERQLAFVKEELRHVPKEKLTVLIMHIPLAGPEGRSRRLITGNSAALHALLQDRPHTVSVSAHRHWHGQFYLGPEEEWHGEKPHHHMILATLCGSWFRGLPKTHGIPHARMTDGTPRGYAVMRFADNHYELEGYRVIGANRGQQMHVELPNVIARDQLEDTLFSVNFYNGCEKSSVQCRFDGVGAWRPMERVIAPDPAYVRIYEHEQSVERVAPYLPMRPPRPCFHLWQSALPDDLADGTHRLEIEATDVYENTYRQTRLVRIAG